MGDCTTQVRTEKNQKFVQLFDVALMSAVLMAASIEYWSSYDIHLQSNKAKKKQEILYSYLTRHQQTQ